MIEFAGAVVGGLLGMVIVDGLLVLALRSRQRKEDQPIFNSARKMDEA